MRSLAPALILATALVGSLAACSTPVDAESCTPLVPSGEPASYVQASGAIGTPPEVTFPTPLRAESAQQAVIESGDEGGAIAGPGQVVDFQVSLFNGTDGELITQTSYDPDAAPVRRTAGADTDILASVVQCAEVGSRIAATGTIADVFGEGQLDAGLGLADDDAIVMVIDVEAAYLAKATGIPSEVWRYYLLAVRPEGGDTSFSWQDFARRNNSDLLNNFGNFVNRAVAFTVARFDGKVPARSADAMTDGDRETIAAVEEETRKYIELLEALKIRDGLRSLMAVSSIGNTYLQENKPWDLLKQGPEAVQRCQNVLNIALHIVHHCAILAQPYMPTVSDRIVAQLNLPGAGDLGSDVLRLGDDGHLNLEALAAGHKLGEPELLFASIPDEAVTAFRERFAGKQDVSPDAAAGDVECTARFVAAQVKSVEAHPSSDTLYVLKLDAGEFGDDRQVVSGLVQHYKPEELQGQRVVLFENIKPSKFRKVMSHGMILCADDNGRLGLLRVDDSVAPGTVLAPSGAKLAPVAKFNTKKHMADLGLAVNAQGTVDCQGLPLEPAPVPDTRRGDFASGTKVR